MCLMTLKIIPINFSYVVICDAPLFIRAHSKAVLSKGIHNDTEFLSTNMVMDYSLLVGIDEATMKLVVGIIGNSVLLFSLFILIHV